MTYHSNIDGLVEDCVIYIDNTRMKLHFRHYWLFVRGNQRWSVKGVSHMRSFDVCVVVSMKTFFEQTADVTNIWDTMMLIWYQCNATGDTAVLHYKPSILCMKLFQPTTLQWRHRRVLVSQITSNLNVNSTVCWASIKEKIKACGTCPLRIHRWPWVPRTKGQ